MNDERQRGAFFSHKVHLLLFRLYFGRDYPLRFTAVSRHICPFLLALLEIKSSLFFLHIVVSPPSSLPVATQRSKASATQISLPCRAGALLVENNGSTLRCVKGNAELTVFQRPFQCSVGDLIALIALPPPAFSFFFLPFSSPLIFSLTLAFT